MNQTKINRIASIEILRFFSSLIILIWHYQHFFNPYNIFSDIDVLKKITIQPLYNLFSVIYTHGWIGVNIFFAISGFIFCCIYVKSEKKITLKNFWVNRFARLYPLHFLTLILVLFLQNFSFNEYGFYQIISVNDFYHFILNLFFISGWGFAENYSFNWPIWSVSLELITYAIFFFSLVNIKKSVFIKALFVLVLLVIFRKLDLVKNVNSPNILINADTGNIFLEDDDLSKVREFKNLFANFQLSEKNLISLLEGYIDHDKILRNFEINNQVVSLEILNLELKEIEENIDFFKSILETHIYSNNEN